MIVAIQILRAIAAFSVVAAHLPKSAMVIPGATYGAFGVDIFFIISGFIMVHTSGPLFGRRDGSLAFLGRRIARIVPLYWTITVAAIALMYALGQDVDLGRVLCSFTFFPYALKGLPIVGPGWTLNYEMLFYVVFAAAMLAGRRGAVAIIAAVFLTMTAIGRAFVLPLPFAFWCDSIILEFVLGALLGLAYAEGLRIPRLAGAALILVGIGALVYTVRLGLNYSPTVDPPLSRSIAWGIPALLIVAGGVLPSLGRKPDPISRRLMVLGDASYSIYLIQALVLVLLYAIKWPLTASEVGIAEFRTTGFVTIVSAVIETGLGFVLIGALAILVFNQFESRATKSVRALFSFRPKSAAAAQTA